jgi:hypothetical protein|nr:MAG TPA: protein of unknown function DUF859 [Caudoviricetes sp.]
MSVFQTLTLEQVGQSIANNTSKVRVKWTSQQTGSSYNDAPGDKAYYYITLNGGTRTEHTVAFTLPQNTTKTILDTTITVNHNTDGTGSVKVDTWMNTEISAGVIEQTKTLTLDTIPRASVVSAPKTTGTLGSALEVKIARKSPSFTDKLYYKVGSKSEVQITAYDGGLTYNWKPPVSLATNAPNSTKLTVTLITKTYNGSTYVGRSECVVELSIPTSVAPTLSVALIDPTKVSTTYGGYVQMRSKIKVELTAAGSYGSTIKSYSIKVGNFYAATTSSGTTDYLPSSGKVYVVCSVTDSRGRTTTTTQPVTVLPYSKPTISAISAARCNQDGSANRAGAYGKVTFSAAITQLSGNTAAYKVQYRAHGAETERWTDAGSVANGEYNPANVSVVFAADTNTRYAVRVVATDKFESVESTIRDLPAAFILMDLAKSKKSVGVGRECDKKNTFQVGLYSHFEKPVNQEVSSNPWYGLNDGTNQWHLQAQQASNKLALGLTWDSSLKIDTNGNVTLPENLTGKYITGTWLQATAATDLGKAPPYVCVFDANGWLYKRKLSELFSDMGIPAQKDYVVERGTSSSWHYEKWNSGKLELWRQTTSSNLGTTGQINGWYYRAYTMALPSNLLKNIQDVQCNCVWGTGVSFASGSADSVNFKAIYFSNQNGGAGTFWHRITGTWR